MGVTPASDPPWSILVFTRQRCVSFKLMGLNNLVRRPPSYKHFFRRARIWRCCGGDPEETPSKGERLNTITGCFCIGQGHTGCWIGFCENRPPRPTAPKSQCWTRECPAATSPGTPPASGAGSAQLLRCDHHCLTQGGARGQRTPN